MMETAFFVAGMTSGIALIRLFIHIDRAGEQTIARMRQQWEAGASDRRDQRVRALRTSAR
ncbi:hypothetical protein ACXPWS_04375 [Mycobacterium sp. BMJ-28]